MPAFRRHALAAAVSAVFLAVLVPASAAAAATKVLDIAPDWVVANGDAEYQHFTLSLDETAVRFHGKLFVAGREAVGAGPGELLACAVGTFSWTGGLDGTEPAGHTGWFPLRETLAGGGFTAGFGMDATDYVDREGGPDRSLRPGGRDLWLAWYADPARPEAGGYGALRVNGKWTVGAAPGDRLRVGDRTFVWGGAYVREGGPARAGWFPAEGE